MTLVKICGIRSSREGRAALDAGADWLGFIFWRRSKRYVEPRSAAEIIARLRGVPAPWQAVGVFVDVPSAEVRETAGLCGLDRIQLHGAETPAYVASLGLPTLKALRVQSGREAEVARQVERNQYGADGYLLDTHREGLPGGTGATFSWEALRRVGPLCFVAGGLDGDNVRYALETLNPLGVDVSSGVEYPGGGKDPRLVQQFMEAVRRYDTQLAVTG